MHTCKYINILLRIKSYFHLEENTLYSSTSDWSQWWLLAWEGQEMKQEQYLLFHILWIQMFGFSSNRNYDFRIWKSSNTFNKQCHDLPFFLNSEETQSFVMCFCLCEVTLCCSQDVFQQRFHLFSWDLPLRTDAFILKSRRWKKHVKRKLLALPPPYSTIYLNSEHMYDGHRGNP